MQRKIIAYLDILGFKQLVQNNTLDELKTIYNDTLKDVDLVLELGEQTIMSFTKDGWPDYKLNITIVSDSIILWNSNDSWEGFSGLLITIRAMCAMALTHGIPLRGAIVIGELDTLHYKSKYIDSQIILGNGLTKAFELEKKSKMMGCIISEEVVEHINNLLASMSGKNIEEAFKENKYIIKYPIPTQNGSEYLYCLNWISIIGDKIRDIGNIENMINEAFSEHNKSTDSDEVKSKIENTIKFIKHCMLKSPHR